MPRPALAPSTPLAAPLFRDANCRVAATFGRLSIALDHVQQILLIELGNQPSVPLELLGGAWRDADGLGHRPATRAYIEYCGYNYDGITISVINRIKSCDWPCFGAKMGVQSYQWWLRCRRQKSDILWSNIFDTNK